jgi:hypothetical protein
MVMHLRRPPRPELIAAGHELLRRAEHQATVPEPARIEQVGDQRRGTERTSLREP